MKRTYKVIFCKFDGVDHTYLSDNLDDAMKKVSIEVKDDFWDAVILQKIMHGFFLSRKQTLIWFSHKEILLAEALTREARI